MGTKNKITRAAASKVIPLPAAGFPLWGILCGLAAAFYLLVQIYSPALHGPFVFDDLYLPYANPQAASIPLKVWLGIRPVLGLSFWTDFHLWGRNPLPYRVINLLLHFGCTVLLFSVFRKLLTFAATTEPNRTLLSLFGAVLFLVHPINTEVAAYVASRSEALSVFFFLAAFCVFLYRRTAAIEWPAVTLVLLMFLLALGSKEHTVTLPALLLLTDYFWNPGFTFAGIRGNARLYLPIALAGVAGAIFIFRYVASDPMIGFHIEGLTPLTYFFTECRAIFKYIQLFVYPAAQNIDYDFPLSHTPTEHGAVFAFAALLLLVAAAFLVRKVYPFASYGFLSFLLLLSPTSSVIPINDVLVERRLYLPFFALVLVLFEALRRVRLRPLPLAGGLAVVCAIFAYATWERAHVWSEVISLFRDAAAKSPGKARVHIGYANALYHEGKCREAAREYEAASHMKTPDYILLFNTAAAYDCMGLSDEAIATLNRSNALKQQPNAYALLGKVQSKQGKLDDSLASFAVALDLDYKFTPVYIYRAAVYTAMGKKQLAYEDYQQCLRLDPQNRLAQEGIAAIAAGR